MATGRPTQKLDHSLRQSIGAGMKSVMGRGGRTYYVLRYMTNSATHKAGAEQKIIIDYVEIGRDPKCQVRFDESQKTVSRRHAAILRDGDNWVLRNLSSKNPTLINGRPVNKQWFLNPGDQIQLSMEGPKLAFVMPSNPSVSSIPLTQRLNLFRRQALLPYKRAITILTFVFLIAISGLSYWLYQVNQSNEVLSSKLVEAVKTAKKIEGNVDSLMEAQMLSAKENNDLKKQVKNLKGSVYNTRKKMTRMQEEQKKREEQAKASGEVNTEELAESLRMYYPDIYYIRSKKLVVEFEGEQEEVDDYYISGTGFLLSDGRFVTARHLIEPWAFIDMSDPNPVDIIINFIVNNGGRAWVQYEAHSYNNTLKFKSSDFSINNNLDAGFEVENPETGEPVMVKLASTDDGSDWAYKRVSSYGKLNASANKSLNLPNGASLVVLGFPYGLGIDDNIEPIHSNVKTASSQRQNNVIVVNGGIEPGNSGGPALYYVDGEYRVVAIVSMKAGSLGLMVPIASIR